MILTSSVALLIFSITGTASFRTLAKITKQHLATYPCALSMSAAFILLVCVIAIVIYILKQDRLNLWVLRAIEALVFVVTIITVAALSCIINILIGTTLIYAVIIALLISLIAIPLTALIIYRVLKFGELGETPETEQDAEAGVAMQAQSPPPDQSTPQEAEESV